MRKSLVRIRSDTDKLFLILVLFYTKNLFGFSHGSANRHTVMGRRKKQSEIHSKKDIHNELVFDSLHILDKLF